MKNSEGPGGGLLFRRSLVGQYGVALAVGLRRFEADSIRTVLACIPTLLRVATGESLDPSLPSQRGISLPNNQWDVCVIPSETVTVHGYSDLEPGMPSYPWFSLSAASVCDPCKRQWFLAVFGSLWFSRPSLPLLVNPVPVNFSNHQRYVGSIAGVQRGSV